MSAPLAGQDKAPFATVARDFLPANQEWEFPRGRINRKVYFNEQWEINKDSFNEQNLKFDCCNIQKGGDIKSIDCAFKRVYEAVQKSGRHPELAGGGVWFWGMLFAGLGHGEQARRPGDDGAESLDGRV